jgi:hypothetical protein
VKPASGPSSSDWDRDRHSKQSSNHWRAQRARRRSHNGTIWAGHYTRSNSSRHARTFRRESLGAFAAEVLAGVEADRRVHAKLTECVGGVPRQRRQQGICLNAIDPEAAPRRFRTISADQPSGLRFSGQSGYQLQPRVWTFLIWRRTLGNTLGSNFPSLSCITKAF